MKKSSVLLIAAAVLLSSCGTVAQMTSTDSGQRFVDGIYSNAPSILSKTEKMEDKAETDALIEKTKASEIYLFGDKKDTVLIPDNMAATIKFDKNIGSTVISVYDNPYDWRNYITNPWYYSPYSIGSSWYWSRYYNPWYHGNLWARPHWSFYGGFYDPWYYGSLYTPWHYSSFYDPWYWGGIYDPWYYGGFYGTWHYMYPHYAGWYGGWYDPYWGHHHHLRPIHGPSHGPSHGPAHKPDNGPRIYTGTRHSTGSDRVTAGTNSLRGSSTVSNRPINRSVTTTRSESAVTSRPAGNTVNKTVNRTSPTNHRKPVTTSPANSSESAPSRNGSQTVNRNSSQTVSRNGNQTVNRTGSQTTTRDNSNYNRSVGTQNFNRGSMSTGSRQTGGGGTVNRSGGMRR